MGWLALAAIGRFWALDGRTPGFSCLWAGGVLYSAGVPFYTAKKAVIPPFSYAPPAISSQSYGIPDKRTKSVMIIDRPIPFEKRTSPSSLIFYE